MRNTPYPSLVAVPLMLATAAIQAQPPALPESFDEFRFIHALVIDDHGSPLRGFHHFYTNEQGASALSQGGPYPVGSVFIGLVYALDASNGQINEGAGAGMFMMTKDLDKPETGQWAFAEFDAEGNYVEQDVKANCFQCHTQVGDRDFVFSRPLDVPVFD